jgi:hypothetical protein
MSTLFDALLETAQLCGIMRSGLTTSAGTVTTLVDTTAYETDDYFNNGTLFIGVARSRILPNVSRIMCKDPA